MSRPIHPAVTFRCRLNLEQCEEREVPTSFSLTPVVPTLDAATTDRLAAVMRVGQTMGNRANVFTRAGDSITFASNFLVPLAAPSAQTDLSGDGSLNATLNYFRSGAIGAANSFANASRAARGGWTAAEVLANLPGELAASKPAFVFVMVGTNDIALGVSAETYRQNLSAIVYTALNAGVIPVLSTIPDIPLYPTAQARLPQFNQVVQDVGESLRVPVWNYWRALQRVPGAGISRDGVHPSVAPTGGGDLTTAGLSYGYNVRNLTALQTLDKLRRVLILGQSPDSLATAGGWLPLTNAVAVAAGDSTGFQVQTVDTRTRQTVGWDAFDGFRGAVRVAVGDVNRDGVPDLVAVTGSDGPAHVKVFDGTSGALFASFYAFDPVYLGGLNVAVGDFDGDGAADIVVGAATGAPHVKIFTGRGQLLSSYYAFDPVFAGGVQVAAADVNRDGFADLVAAAGTGGRGHVVVRSVATNQQLASFYAFGPEYEGTVSLAAGDFEGTGAGRVAVGARSGGHVIVFDVLTGARVGSFFAYGANFGAGVGLAAVTRGRASELWAVSDPAGIADVRHFDVGGGVRDRFAFYESGYARGASFGG